MSRRVKVIDAWKDPILDAVHVEVIAEGVPLRIVIQRADLLAAKTKQDKRRLVADRALAQLDDKATGSPYSDLFGDIDI